MYKLLAKNNLEFYDKGVGYNYDYEFPYMHTHDYWEFVYTVFPINHSINGERVEIPADRVFVIKPSDKHSISAVQPPVNPHKEPTHINLKITPEKLKEMLAVYDFPLSEKLETRDFPVLEINGDEQTYFKTNLNNIIWSRNAEYQSAVIKMMIMYICLKNFGNVFSLPPNTAPNIPDEIKKVAKKLTSPAFFNQNITEITEETGYSKMQLSRLFKKYFSKTMYDYFLDAKLMYAQNKLLLSDANILSIASDIGFSLSHFDHVFRAKYGKSPIEYRNNARGNEKGGRSQTAAKPKS